MAADLERRRGPRGGPRSTDDGPDEHTRGCHRDVFSPWSSRCPGSSPDVRSKCDDARRCESVGTHGRRGVSHSPSGASRPVDRQRRESGRDRDVIGVVVRRASSAPRVAGQLEEFYLSTADILFAMLISGQFPVPETVTGATGRPRIGDGVVRLDSSGTVAYASPNAVSALRRLGLATDVVGADFSGIVTRLLQRHGTVDAAVADLARGRVAGRADIEGSNATVLVRSIPLRSSGPIDGAVLLLRDTTDIRRRERALLSKDATIREIHHRVKNNLQTVAALLRLQSRRSSDEAISAALGDAQVRVAAIAVVHEALSSDSSNETDLGESVEFDRIVRALFSLSLIHI